MRFLNAIDLGSDGEAKTTSEDPWSTTYFAVLCLENLFSNCEKYHTHLLHLIKTLTMTESLVFVTTKYENYWVRLSTQRLFSLVFALAKDESALSSVCCLEENDLLKLIY